MKAKRVLGLLLSATMLMGVLSGCGSSESEVTSDDTTQTSEAGAEVSADGETDPWVLAATDPYAPYPETVNYTIGITVDPNKSYPEGSTDTAENSIPDFTKQKSMYRIQTILKQQMVMITEQKFLWRFPAVIYRISWQ